MKMWPPPTQQWCEPDNAGGKRGTPAAVPGSKLKVWLPWRGDKDPAACDTNRTAPFDPAASMLSSLDTPHFVNNGSLTLHAAGWCWDKSFAGGANVPRPGLPSKTGAPNPEHGFVFTLRDDVAKRLASQGLHRLDVQVALDAKPTTGTQYVSVRGSPVCFRGGTKSGCTRN